MPTFAQSSPSTAPAPVRSALTSVRRRTLVVGGVRIALQTSVAFAISLFVVMLLDWCTLPGNDAWRPWFSAIPWTAAAVFAVWRGRGLFTKELPWNRVASAIDQAHAGFEERLQTLAETSHPRGIDPNVHPALARRLAFESERLAPEVRPNEVVPTRPLHVPLAALTTLGLVLLIGLFAYGLETRFLLSRFCAPWTVITLTKLENSPERVIVARGESAVLSVNLAGQVPRTAKIEFRDAEGLIESRTLRVSSEGTPEVSFRVDRVEEAAEFRWQAGDAQTEWGRLIPADRPHLAQAQFTATPPKYTDRPVEQRAAIPGNAVLVEGSRLELAFQADQDLRSLWLELSDNRKFFLTPDEQGWYRWQAVVTDGFTFSCRMISDLGLENLRPPRCRVTVYRDQSPKVKILSPTPDTAVNAEDEVEIALEAHDDFAITRAELVVYEEGPDASDMPVRVIPIDLGEQAGEREVSARVKMPLEEFELDHGQAISYAVRVFDNRQTLPVRDIGEDPLVASALETPDNDPAPSPEMTSEPAERVNEREETPSSSDTEQNGTEAHEEAPDQLAGDEEAGNVDAPVESGSDSPSSRSGQAVEQESDNEATAQSTLRSGKSGVRAEGTDDPSGEPEESPARGAGASDPSADNDSQGNDSSSKGGQAEVEPREETGVPSPDPASEGSENPGEAQSSASSADRPASSPSAAESSRKTRGAGETQGKQGSANTQGGRTETDARPAPQEEPSDPSSAARSGSASIPSENAPTGKQARPSQKASTPGSVSVPEGMLPGRATNQPESPEPEPSQPESSQAAQPSQGNPMSRRFLDLPQVTTSSQRKIRVDEFAGSFEGQQREKLAIAITPILHDLDQWLGEAEDLAERVVKRVEENEVTTPADLESLELIDELLDNSEQTVGDLVDRTRDTVYAFVGVQIDSIVSTHVTPARNALWESRASTSGQRESIGNAWQGIRRARVRLAELTKSFDRIRRDHRLAETAKKLEKMYQVFIEDSLTQLQANKKEINNYQRRVGEYQQLDEEYLKRLREVLEMRNKLRAELARMLQDDPRLARRFMDNAARRTESLRDQVTLLAERQKKLGREVQAWGQVEESRRPELLAVIQEIRHRRMNDISQETAKLHERIVTWLPLDIKANDPSLREPLERGQAAATAAAELAEADRQDDLEGMTGALLTQLQRLEDTLRGLGANTPATSGHVQRRRAETRRLISRVESWRRQTRLLREGQYQKVAAIEQHQLALETDTLASKLANLESQLTAGVQLESEVKSRVHAIVEEALQTLDSDIAANQLAATFALRSNRFEKALEKEIAAVKAFDQLESLLDQVFRIVIDELDKMPLQDPIASLLQDPIFDDMLAQLEDEINFAEELGIPLRPSNLRILTDWARNNRGGSMGSRVSAQLRQEADRSRKNAEQAHKRAVDRALKVRRAVERQARLELEAQERAEWNALFSTVPDTLLQGRGDAPPEQYRVMIEQYFSIISQQKQDREPSLPAR